jgi:hypothetical protein
MTIGSSKASPRRRRLTAAAMSWNRPARSSRCPCRSCGSTIRSVRSAKSSKRPPSKTGIRIKARIAKIDEPGKLKDRLDEAWQSIKTKLVRGFVDWLEPIEAAPLKTGGLHVLSLGMG